MAMSFEDAARSMLNVSAFVPVTVRYDGARWDLLTDTNGYPLTDATDAASARAAAVDEMAVNNYKLISQWIGCDDDNGYQALFI